VAVAAGGVGRRRVLGRGWGLEEWRRRVGLRRRRRRRHTRRIAVRSAGWASLPVGLRKGVGITGIRTRIRIRRGRGRSGSSMGKRRDFPGGGRRDGNLTSWTDGFRGVAFGVMGIARVARYTIRLGAVISEWATWGVVLRGFCIRKGNFTLYMYKCRARRWVGRPRPAFFLRFGD
jgi:hypothetical protein